MNTTPHKTPHAGCCRTGGLGLCGGARPDPIKNHIRPPNYRLYTGSGQSNGTRRARAGGRTTPKKSTRGEASAPLAREWRPPPALPSYQNASLPACLPNDGRVASRVDGSAAHGHAALLLKIDFYPAASAQNNKQSARVIRIPPPVSPSAVAVTGTDVAGWTSLPLWQNTLLGSSTHLHFSILALSESATDRASKFCSTTGQSRKRPPRFRKIRTRPY